MLLRISKIQTFESNSQPLWTSNSFADSCSEYQRYKLLKAIHNPPQMKKLPRRVAQNIKDTNFWKQFTTFRVVEVLFFCCSEYQRYKLLKAIHNSSLSNSNKDAVAQNIKDTNFWKQFTTAAFRYSGVKGLLRISKIQTFESNSQQIFTPISHTARCSEYQRYKLLKAIHNRTRSIPL